MRQNSLPKYNQSHWPTENYGGKLRSKIDVPRISWLAGILVTVIILSPIFTYHGAMQAALEATREYSKSPVVGAGYYARELAYFVLAILGITSLLRRRSGVLALLFISTYMAVLVTKDVVIYGSLEWSPYGLRPVVILLSIPVLGPLLLTSYKSNINPKNLILVTIKSMLIALVILTMYQLATLPPLFGKTYIGPRTLGLWPSPLHYSMALASFALLLYVSDARRAFVWILVCLALAITTGGRAGLLAIFLLLSVIAFPGLQIGGSNNKIKALFFAIFILVALPILVLVLSSEEISGRSGTERSGLNDPRVEYIISTVNDTVLANVGTMLVGVRLGDGTNAVTTRDDEARGSDNFFLMILRSYGLIGLFVLVTGLILFLRKISPYKGILAVGGVLLPFSLSQSFLELHPTGLLVLASASLAYAKSKSSNRIQMRYPSPQ